MYARTLFFVAGLCATVCSLGCQQMGQALGSHDPASWSKSDPNDRAHVKPAREPRIAPVTHFAAARLYEQHRQYAQAIEQYRLAIALNHSYVEAYNRLGMLLDRLGRFEEADAEFRRALQIQPDDPRLRNNLGFSYLLQRRWAGAEDEFRSALRLKPDFPRARTNLAVVLGYTGRYPEALAEFRKAMPETDALYNLGLLHGEQQEYDDAMALFRRVLELDDKFVAARTQLTLLAERGTPVSTGGSPTAGEATAVAPVAVREMPSAPEPVAASEGDVGPLDPLVLIDPVVMGLVDAEDRSEGVTSAGAGLPPPIVQANRPASLLSGSQERDAPVSSPAEPETEAAMAAVRRPNAPLPRLQPGFDADEDAAEPELRHVNWDAKCIADAIEFINLLMPAPALRRTADDTPQGPH